MRWRSPRPSARSASRAPPSTSSRKSRRPPSTLCTRSTTSSSLPTCQAFFRATTTSAPRSSRRIFGATWRARRSSTWSIAPRAISGSVDDASRRPRADVRLLRGDARDLHEVARGSQARLHGGAGGRIGGIHPRVPHAVHVVVVAHVGEPDSGGEELGLAAPRGGEQLVELLEDLLGLALHVRVGIAGDLARDVDGVAADDGCAQTLARLDPLDGHQSLLGLA